MPVGPRPPPAAPREPDDAPLFGPAADRQTDRQTVRQTADAEGGGGRQTVETVSTVRSHATQCNAVPCNGMKLDDSAADSRMAGCWLAGRLVRLPVASVPSPSSSRLHFPPPLSLCSLQSLMWCPGWPQLKQTGAPPSSLNTHTQRADVDVCVSSWLLSFRPLPLRHAALCPCSCPCGDLRLAMAAGGSRQTAKEKEWTKGNREQKKQKHWPVPPISLLSQNEGRASAVLERPSGSMRLEGYKKTKLQTIVIVMRLRPTPSTE